jgi:hypothetical protein
MRWAVYHAPDIDAAREAYDSQKEAAVTLP